MDLPRNIRWLVRIFLQVEIAQTETNPTLGISQAWGWRIVPSFGIGRAWGCGNVLSLGIRRGSRYGLGTRRGSRYVLGWPRSIGQRSVVRQCSELGDLAGEQVCFRLAQEHWPAEHFGQLGQRSVLQPLQYSTGTEVVR